MDIFDYSTNREEFARAAAVIPGGIYGHLGPARGCHMPVSAYPFYASKAKGAHIWDSDGNKFIDHMSAYGTMICGYANNDIDDAALQACRNGDCTTLPSTLSIDLAELLVDTIHSAEWAIFAKNGSDTVSLAMMTARSATGRDKIIMYNGSYHGTHTWMRNAGDPGIAAADVANTIYIDWNNLQQLEDAIAAHEGDIAALIATPYMQYTFADNVLPAPGYWNDVRSICTAHGIVLILDDIRTGWRLDLAGSDHYFGFEADLICCGGALANGWNISALCGKDSLKNACSSVSYTGTYWHSAAPIAAAIATLTKLREHEDACGYMRMIGESLTSGLESISAQHGFHMVTTGEPCFFSIRLADDDNFVLHQEFIAECVKRGALFAPHHNHFTNLAETMEDVDQTLIIANEAFSAVASQHPDMGFTA